MNVKIAIQFLILLILLVFLFFFINNSFFSKNQNIIDLTSNNNVRTTEIDLKENVSNIIENGEPIGTEMLRYGLRVAVIGMPAPVELKTPEALAVVGPEAFGYEGVPFEPLPGNLL